jgi:hypothetical protein
VHRFSKNLRSHFKIPGAIRVTRSKPQTENPRTLKFNCTKCFVHLTVTTPKRQSRATPCIHFITCNIMIPSTSKSSKWFLSFRLPHQNLVHFCPPSQCHVLRPFHPFVYKSWSFSLSASYYFLTTTHYFPSLPFVFPSDVWIRPQDCWERWHSLGVGASSNSQMAMESRIIMRPDPC